MNFDEVFAAISGAASSGAQGSGTIANWLISAGLSAAAITQILNGVATSSAASPDMIRYAQQEMAYLQQNYAQQQERNKMLWIGAGILALFLLTRKNN